MSPSTDHTTSRGRRDEHSEHDAVRYVSEYATRELGVVEIRDRQPDKCGWDLEFVYADGRLDLVEVKGSTSSRPFEITRNELEKSRTHDNYVLYFLAGQGTDSPVLYRFDDFGTRVDDATHLRAASWAVVGWQELDPQAIAVTLPSG